MIELNQDDLSGDGLWLRCFDKAGHTLLQRKREALLIRSEQDSSEEQAVKIIAKE